MIKTYVTIERRSADGILLEKRKQESRSWLKHFFDLWYEELGSGIGASLPVVYDITNTPRALSVTWNGAAPNLSIGGAPGNVGVAIMNNGNGAVVVNGDLLGIQLGTDPTAVTPQDNSLVARIPHGETSGLILYGGNEILGFAVADPDASFNIRRYFTNASGGDIVVQETGIYSCGQDNSNNLDLFCICRDIVSPAVTVADTEILFVVYTVAITV